MASPTVVQPRRCQRQRYQHSAAECNRNADSWIQAPRWRGNAMEAGPLARTLIAYHKGDAATVESVDRMIVGVEPAAFPVSSQR
ncbi:nickel-dependent hydrogenase large subunit [Shigella flexneri]